MTAVCEGPGKCEEGNKKMYVYLLKLETGNISICKLGFLFVKF
jgi:hypothetical protein